MKKTYYSYKECVDDCKVLLPKLKLYDPDTIVPIARGGLTLGHILSEAMNIRDVCVINSIHYNNTKKLDSFEIFNIPDLSKAKKVLIVDDDIKNIFVLDTALQEHDMNIDHAKNGKEALDFLKNNQNIDIVLMDIMMPIMNGYEAIKQIRKDNINIPIIAVTAKSLKDDKLKAIEVGANDFVTKPIDITLLVNLIKVWCDKNTHYLTK